MKLLGDGYYSNNATVTVGGYYNKDEDDSVQEAYDDFIEEKEADEDVSDLQLQAVEEMMTELVFSVKEQAKNMSSL